MGVPRPGASHEADVVAPGAGLVAAHRDCRRGRAGAWARLAFHSPEVRTELKRASLKDLCALGGWKDHNTILECYQQPNPDTMRVALESRGRLRSVTRQLK